MGIASSAVRALHVALRASSLTWKAFGLKSTWSIEGRTTGFANWLTRSDATALRADRVIGHTGSTRFNTNPSTLLFGCAISTTRDEGVALSESSFTWRENMCLVTKLFEKEATIFTHKPNWLPVQACGSAPGNGQSLERIDVPGLGATDRRWGNFSPHRAFRLKISRQRFWQREAFHVSVSGRTTMDWFWQGATRECNVESVDWQEMNK